MRHQMQASSEGLSSDIGVFALTISHEPMHKLLHVLLHELMLDLILIVPKVQACDVSAYAKRENELMTSECQCCCAQYAMCL